MTVLDNVTVLDFTHGVAGPFGTMILGDMGADIIKVETPGRGDVSRFMNMSDRFKQDVPRSGGDYFATINRNKRSVALDLKTEAGRRIAQELAAGVDIVVQSFRPGVMDRLGLGSEALQRQNPSLIYGSLAAFSDRGPRAGQPGMDVGIQALSGVMSVTGEPGQGPLRPGVSLSDFSGGVHLVVGLLGALFERSVTGRGRRVDVSLLDATMAMLSNYSVAVLDGGMDLKPMGSGHPQLVPYQSFPTADGNIVIATGTNRLFRELCRCLGLEAVSEDPRYQTNPLRVENRDSLVALLTETLQRESTAHWLDRLSANGIPVAPVHTMHEALTSDELVLNDMIQTHDHPVFGEMHLVGSPYRFDGDRPAAGRRPPLLAEHTAEVLTERLGLSADDLAELTANGAIDVGGPLHAERDQ